MNMLVLHDDNQIYKLLNLTGWVTTPNGKKLCSPPKAGWEGEGYKISEVFETPPPVFNETTQKSSSNIELVEGVPTRVWMVTNLSAEEIAARDNVSTITKLQLRSELVARGLWGQFKAYLAANPDAEEEFLYASSLDIDHPSAIAIAAGFGVDIQELFNSASKR